jgi:hypothetical protein
MSPKAALRLSGLAEHEKARSGASLCVRPSKAAQRPFDCFPQRLLFEWGAYE